MAHAVRVLRPRFDGELPEHVDVEVRVPDAWPSAWGQAEDVDGGTLIQISPELDDPVQVLCVLLHELCHAAVGPGYGHNGAYRPVWRRVGFQGLPTLSEPSRGLLAFLERTVQDLGPYPET